MRQKRKQVKQSTRLTILVNQRVCQYCGKASGLEIDHKVPSILGGDNSIENLQLLCYACNEIKGIRTHSDETKSYVLAVRKTQDKQPLSSWNVYRERNRMSFYNNTFLVNRYGKAD